VAARELTEIAQILQSQCAQVLAVLAQVLQTQQTQVRRLRKIVLAHPLVLVRRRRTEGEVLHVVVVARNFPHRVVGKPPRAGQVQETQVLKKHKVS